MFPPALYSFYSTLTDVLFWLIYNRPVELLESGTIRPISKPKMGRFLNRSTGKNQFLFRESKLFLMVSSIKKLLPSTLESTSNHESCPFFGQTPYNFDLP